MSPSERKNDPISPGLEPYCTTHWSVVLLAGEEAAPLATEALEKLCRIYRYPLYTYLRRLSYSPHDAQNLTRDFFTWLIKKSVRENVDRRKGKFRPFLLASLNHFLANERDQAQALNRSAEPAPIGLEEQDPESQYLQEPLADLSPERMFERQWALALLGRALARLRDEYAGKTRHFQLLKAFLTNDPGDGVYGPATRELNVSAGSITVIVQRMRQRYRELVRAEIADTVASTGDIDDELRWLYAALSY